MNALPYLPCCCACCTELPSLCGGPGREHWGNVENLLGSPRLWVIRFVPIAETPGGAGQVLDEAGSQALGRRPNPDTALEEAIGLQAPSVSPSASEFRYADLVGFPA